MSTFKVGFVGTNLFQLLHVSNLIEAIPESCFLFIRKKRTLPQFAGNQVLADKVVPITQSIDTIKALDGVFDILVCQTPFKYCYIFKKTKLAMLQYGYAKEPHNYGVWRSLADLNLVYGPYAERKISYFSPVVTTGNPAYDKCFNKEWQQSARNKYGKFLDNDLKTILYAPTWGDLSSIETFIDAVINLKQNYNILIKIHHNTDIIALRDKYHCSYLNLFWVQDNLLELISVCDVLISDYSGAIFDGLFMKKPLVLLDSWNLKANRKIDEYSIEYSRRRELGLTVAAPADLADAVARLLSLDNSNYAQENIRKALFCLETGAVDRVVSALDLLAKGNFKRTQQQQYVRDAYVEYLELKERQAKIPRLIRELFNRIGQPVM